jgi:chromosome segregation ATPase
MSYRVLYATIATVFAAMPLQAQQPFPKGSPTTQRGASTAPADQARRETPNSTFNFRLALDEFLVLVPLRNSADIQADIDRSRRDEERAQEEKRNAEQLERLARDQLEAQKKEIDAIKARLKVAKNDDRETDAIVLESDKKLAEGAEQLLVKRRDMRRKEITGWDKVAKLAASTRKAAELELELASARDALRDFGTRGSAEEARRLERRVSEIEKRTLEAQADRADLRAQVAKTEKDVVKSRLQLLKTRSKIESGG